MNILIIVLNWNGIKDTIKCLDSLLLQSYSLYDILVVGNGSRDNSVDILKEYSKNNVDKIKVVYNNENRGFAGGVNTGIRWALNRNYDYVALFNNDAVADKNWLSELTSSIDKSGVGIATGLLLSSDGESIDSTGEQYSTWGLPFPRNRSDIKSSAPASGLTFGATGGATLYKSALFRDIGLFDEDFFAYYEDGDISFRAQLAGWKVYYNSKAVAYHEKGSSSKKIPGFIVTQTFRNLPWVYIKNVPLKLMLSIGSKLLLVYCLFFANAIWQGNTLPAIKGVVRSLLLIPKKVTERRRIQSSRRVSTDYIESIIYNDLPPDQIKLRKLRKIILRK